MIVLAREVIVLASWRATIWQQLRWHQAVCVVTVVAGMCGSDPTHQLHSKDESVLIQRASRLRQPIFNINAMESSKS